MNGCSWRHVGSAPKSLSHWGEEERRSQVPGWPGLHNTISFQSKQINEQEEWLHCLCFLSYAVKLLISVVGASCVVHGGNYVLGAPCMSHGGNSGLVLFSSEELWAFTCFIYQASISVRLGAYILVSELNLSYVLPLWSWDVGKLPCRVGVPCSAFC